MHVILHSFTYPLKPLTQSPISIQPIPILHATHNHVLLYPDVSHPEFFSADIPPGCLASGILSGQRSTLSGCFTSGILPRRHFTRIPHIQNSSPPTFHPDASHLEFCPADVLPYPDISHPEFCPPDVPHSPNISHLEFCPANVQPSSDISHSEFCPTDVPPFSSSLEQFLEVPKISFSINFAVIFFSTCNFNNFHDFKMF